MTTIKRLGATTLLLFIADREVFYSYDTPVAAKLSDGHLVRTNENFSRTTSKHIAQYLNGRIAEYVDQSFFTQLMGGS